MKINADSYITNWIVYRLSNYSIVIGIVLTLILVTYHLMTQNNSEDGNVYLILGVLIFLSLIVGRIARLISGGYFWHHIKDNLKVGSNSIELENKQYDLNKVELLKFNITDFENKKPFLYQYIIKDKRNMIKFKTNENIVQIHFKPEKESENEYLMELKRVWNK